MWNGPGWGPMYGWWIMPLFALVFLVIILFIISRFFGGAGGFCGRTPSDRSLENEIREMRNDIREIREEIKELKRRDSA
ncbi:MAG: hypothetical protein IT388_01170 [Nitrospirales bacterium]|nr:hypothetical protein [Nitrospirales bacterium]